MDSPRCCFEQLTHPLIVDTSVAINLVATGCSSTIICAVPNEFVIVTSVQSELSNGNLRGADHVRFSGELVEQGLIVVSALGDSGLALFEELVSGPAQETLDDGEAATIALAVEQEGIALIDERKATRICVDKFPSLPLASTMDIFVHPGVKKALGNSGVGAAVFNALRSARMNVQPHYLDWVATLIGAEKVSSCPSLPQRIRCARDTRGK